MKAFHADAKIKSKYLKRVEDHQKADEIIHGTYWQDGKGCAVGCTIEGDQHQRYETELGIPESIARLEDFLFEGMKNGEAKTFPARFLKAVPVGADLSLVPAKFILFVLNDVANVKEAKADANVLAAIENIADLWQRVINGKVVKDEEWSAARSAARSAAWSAACKKYADYLLTLLKESPTK